MNILENHKAESDVWQSLCILSVWMVTEESDPSLGAGFTGSQKEYKMRYLGVLALLGLVAIPAGFAQAQRVSVGIGFGGPVYAGPAYVVPAPVCAYGYYPDYPYACAPYGYYGPSWFSGGVFIGAGPWFHGGFYGRPGFWGRPGFYSRPGFRHDFDDHERGWGGRGPQGGFHGGDGFHGSGLHSFNSGGGFHGGGGRGFHGGGRR
jgi:hypothetical protein